MGGLVVSLSGLAGFLESFPLICPVGLKAARVDPCGLCYLIVEGPVTFALLQIHVAHPPVMAGDKGSRRFDRDANNALQGSALADSHYDIDISGDALHARGELPESNY